MPLAERQPARHNGRVCGRRAHALCKHDRNYFCDSRVGDVKPRTPHGSHRSCSAPAWLQSTRHDLSQNMLQHAVCQPCAACAAACSQPLWKPHLQAGQRAVLLPHRRIRASHIVQRALLLSIRRTPAACTQQTRPQDGRAHSAAARLQGATTFIPWGVHSLGVLRAARSTARPVPHPPRFATSAAEHAAGDFIIQKRATARGRNQHGPGLMHCARTSKRRRRGAAPRLRFGFLCKVGYCRVDLPVLAHGARHAKGAVARQLQGRLEQVHSRLRLALAQPRDARVDGLARRPRPV